MEQTLVGHLGLAAADIDWRPRFVEPERVVWQDRAFRDFTVFVETCFEFSSVDVVRTEWRDLGDDFWATFDASVASEFVSWFRNRPRARARRRSGRHRQFQRWFAYLCEHYRHDTERVLAVAEAAIRLSRRAGRRRRPRLRRDRAIRAIAAESTTVIRRHGPPAGRATQARGGSLVTMDA